MACVRHRRQRTVLIPASWSLRAQLLLGLPIDLRKVASVGNASLEAGFRDVFLPRRRLVGAREAIFPIRGRVLRASAVCATTARICVVTASAPPRPPKNVPRNPQIQQKKKRKNPP